MRRSASVLLALLSGCATMQEAARTRHRAEDVVAHALASPSLDERLEATRIAAGVADPTLDPLLAERLGDGDAAIRATAAAALVRAARPAADVLAAILDGANGGDAAARVIAIDGVRALPDWRARLQQLARDPDLRVRARVATAIGQLRPPDARALLSTLVHDADAGVRGQALYGLLALDDRGALDDVTHALDDADLGVRLAALGALVRLAHDDAQPRLLALASGNDPYLAARAAVHLSHAGKRAAALAAVTNAAHDRNAAVRRAALNAAGELGDDGAALATAALADPDADVRFDAARVRLSREDHRGGDVTAGERVMRTFLADARYVVDAAAELARYGDPRGRSCLFGLIHVHDAALAGAARRRWWQLPDGRQDLVAALDAHDARIRLDAAAILLERAFRDAR